MKVLFICTHNRCRSIIAEAVTNHFAGNIIQAKSAGSQPAGKIHPMTLQFLQEKGIDTTALKSQSWDDHETFEPDIVITVCDHAANEPCPVWFGNSIQVHWGLPDPSKLTESSDILRRHFFDLMEEIKRRIDVLADLVTKETTEEELTKALSVLATA